MPVTVLVATPHAAFGELLRISLLDSGAYQIKLVQSAQAAREAFGAPDSPPFDLAIFDSALADEPFSALCRDLLAQQPGVRLMIIPPDNNPNHPSLGGLIPHGYLNRPFYLPDLLETVKRLLLAPGQVTFNQTAQKPGPTSSAGDAEISLPRKEASIAATGADGGMDGGNAQLIQDALVSAMPKLRALAALVGICEPEPRSAKLVAQAGSLPEENARVLAEVAFRYWDTHEKSDLMRYIHIPQDRNDFLVYATRISGDVVLLMVHDNTTPVSLIRPQARGMAQTLDRVLHGEKGLASAAVRAQMPASSDLRTQPLDDEEFIARLERSGLEQNKQAAQPNQPDTQWASAGIVPGLDSQTQPAGGSPGWFVEAEPEETVEPDLAPRIDLMAMLGEVPSPDPEHGAAGENRDLHRFAGRETPTIPGGVTPAPAPEEWGNPLAHSDVEHPDAQHPDAEAIPSHKRQTEPLDPARLSHALITPDSPPEKGGHAAVFIYPEVARTGETGTGGYEAGGYQAGGRQAQQLSAGVDVKTEPPINPTRMPTPLEDHEGPVFTFPAEPPPGPEDTQPSVISTLTRLDQLEPVSPALSMLKYTCVILPRLPQHYLTGELADRLAAWVPQACLAYGWRLEAIAIRPDYLQWTVQVAPAISPGNLVRILRQRISYHIFGAFPNLGEQNPSGDFWATGYLIVSGPQPPSAQLLRDYILQTRKRQGVLK